MKMMKAVNTILVKKGRAEEILARFQTPKSVHTFEGFVLMEVLKRENSLEHDELQICTTWEDRMYFDHWLSSRESQKAHGRKNEQKSEDNPIIGSQLTTFEVVYQHKPVIQQI